ncbi:MAG: polysaccharide export periplasmic protein, partial [Cyclobacteriaceae bacterium]|nr:polysaccharide export periplasmic protein [Cyclobacteriaceae bacterium]
EKFTSLYNALYVKIKFESKRVVVLGASGGQVIPLYYPGTRLSEIVALAGGVNLNGKAHNIRVLRGDDIIVADLSTVKGYKETNIIMQPDDIVYIETVRKPFIESVRDYSPLLSIATSIISITALIIGLR